MKSFARAALTIAALACAASASAGTYHFPAGTPIQLATLTDVNTKRVRSGDRVYLNVTAPLVAGGETIVPVNSTATGQVAGMERNGHFGKAGRLSVRILYIDTPRMRIPLVGDASARGHSGRAVSAGAYMVAGLLPAFLIHGTSAVIHAGTPVTALIGDDMSVYAADHGSPRPGDGVTASIAR